MPPLLAGGGLGCIGHETTCSSRLARSVSENDSISGAILEIFYFIKLERRT
jgi:hypothetical protein